jgi:Nuf2 family
MTKQYNEETASIILQSTTTATMDNMALNHHQRTTTGTAGSSGAGAGNNKPHFIFPLLKSAEILQCLSELEIEMKNEELKEPSSHKQKLRQAWIVLVRTYIRTLVDERCHSGVFVSLLERDELTLPHSFVPYSL